MHILPTVDGSLNHLDRAFYGLAGFFTGILGVAGAIQTTKSIANPSGTPVLRATLPGWATELKAYLDREFGAIHRELNRLYTVKKDL